MKTCKKCGTQYAEYYCRPCRKIYAESYYQANKEKIKATTKQWQKDNPEASKPVHNKYGKRFQPVDLVKARIAANNRRARKMQNGGSLSPNIIDALLKKQNWKCACCDAPILDDYHLDHIVPLSLGGENSDINVQILLPKCNWRKGARWIG